MDIFLPKDNLSFVSKLATVMYRNFFDSCIIHIIFLYNALVPLDFSISLESGKEVGGSRQEESFVSSTTLRGSKGV